MQSYRVKMAWLSILSRSLAILFLVSAFLFSFGCGSSSTTTTTPAGPAPTFTSVAPTIAREGVLYTYNLTATTTDNSTVTFALTSGPTGATISGGTLSWTPTHAESRIANGFTITATTSKDGTATQTFTLTPTGYVNGTAVDHTVTGTGIADHAEDLSGSTVEALVPNGKGGFNSFKGTSDASGDLSIANVPTGYFWLHVMQPVGGAVSNNYIWTNASDIDLGTLVTGRANAVPIRTGVTVSTNVGLTVSPTSGDTIGFQSPDAGASASPTGTVTNPYIASFPQTGNLIDGSQGDRAFLVHYTHSAPAANVTVHSIAEDIEYTNLQETDGSTVHLTGNMTAVSGSTTDPVINLGLFDTLWAGLNNNPSVQRSFDVVDSGYDGTYGYANGVNLIHSDLSQTNANVDLGSLSFGVVTSGGVPFYNFIDTAPRKFPFPGGTITLLAGSEIISKTLPTSATPIIPILNLPQSPTIDGQNFYYNQTNTSLAPQVSWGPPTIGTATYYELILFDVTSAQPVQYNFYTNGSGAAIPAGILQTGHTYVLQLIAAYDSAMSFSSAPFRHGTAPAFTFAPSGEVTGGVPPGSTTRNSANSTTHSWQLVLGRDERLHLQQVN